MDDDADQGAVAWRVGYGFDTWATYATRELAEQALELLRACGYDSWEVLPVIPTGEAEFTEELAETFAPSAPKPSDSMTDEEQAAERARWRAEIQRRIAELDLAEEFERQGHTTYASADVNGVLEIRGITLEDFRIHLAQHGWTDEEAEVAWRRGWRPDE